MKAEVYKINSDGSYLLMPQGNSPSLLPKLADDKISALKFYKTIEIQTDMLGLSIAAIQKDFDRQGYSILPIERAVLQQLVIKSESLNEFIKMAVSPQWFALWLTLTYVAGFLSVYTFQDRFGIYEGGGDFLKSKYIQAGILFLLFPISILLPFVLKISLKNAEKREKIIDFKFPFSTMLSFFNISCVFYLFLFTPRNFFFSKVPIIAVIILITFLGPIVGDFIVKKFIVPEYHQLRVFARWFFVLVIFGLDIFVFLGFWKHMWTIFWGANPLKPNGLIWYFIFMIMIPYSLWRNSKHAKKLPPGRSRTEVRLLGACIALMFLFFGIVSFALHAYPYIPVAKGGGNYCESPLVNLTFHQATERDSLTISNDPTLLALSTSNCFVLIEQSPSALYLASVTDAGGPIHWVNMRDLPHIIEIRREIVDKIYYTPVIDTNFFQNL